MQPLVLHALTVYSTVIVEVVLRVFKYPQDIWAGSILVPRSELPRVADSIVQFLSNPVDPKVTMMMYVVKKKLLESFRVDTDMVVIHAFDACGEEHGRACFKWALDIPGAIDKTMITNLLGVSALQGKSVGTRRQIFRGEANARFRQSTYHQGYAQAVLGSYAVT